MIYYYTLFTVFAVILTMMIVDPNVSDYIYLINKLVVNKFKRLYWMIRFHPFIFSNPIGQWWMMRKHMRTAEELAQEFSKKQDDGV
jgi:hypothetical protein